MASLKTLFLPQKMTYDGTQLKPLEAYMKYGLQGHSCLAFIGPCAIDFSHMVDGEDLRAQSPIQSDEMVHFIFEIFDVALFSGVLLQRLFAAIVADVVKELSPQAVVLRREGDDLFLRQSGVDKKLSISIATRAVGSILIHFAVNTTNKGTPVPTLSLADLQIEPQSFAQTCLLRIQDEYADIWNATYKVRSVF